MEAAVILDLLLVLIKERWLHFAAPQGLRTSPIQQPTKASAASQDRSSASMPLLRRAPVVILIKYSALMVLLVKESVVPQDRRIPLILPVERVVVVLPAFSTALIQLLGRVNVVSQTLKN